MKSIIAMCFVLAVASANPFWGDFNQEWHRHHPPPPPKCEPQKQGSLLPGHLTLSLSSLLEHLFFFKATQKNGATQSCTAVWICRKPETGDIVVTEIDGTQTVVSKELSKEDSGRTSSTERNSKDIDDVENMNNGTPKTSPSEEMVATEAINTDGVGIIDIRASLK